MKLCIAGSRTIEGYWGSLVLADALRTLFAHYGISEMNITAVISGCARGADTLGEAWAAEEDIPVLRMPADWDRYGKKAGYLRNVEMAEVADLVLIVWDGRSRGSQHMREICHKRRVPYYLYTVSSAYAVGD
jgi:hypothetical protein